MPHATISILMVVIVGDHLQAGDPAVGEVQAVVRLSGEFLKYP